MRALSHRPASRRAPRATLTTLAAMLLAAGCAAHPTAPAASNLARPAACPSAASTAASQHDATATALAALAALWSVDTAADSGWRDAALRAAPDLTPAFLAALRAAPDPADPGGDWTVWREHRATITATARPTGDAPPPDTATRAQRADLITLTPTGRDGWHGPTRTLIVYVTLTRACPAAPWLVAALEATP